MLQPDPRARKAISQLLVAQPGYAEKPLLEHETNQHKHWNDSTKADVLQLWRTHGWHAVHVRYPGLAWTTASYWRNHPGVRQHGSGGHAALNDQQRFEVAQAICRSRRCGEDLGLAQVRQLALAKASPDSNFKASYTWMQGLLTEFGLAGPFKPHPRSAAWFSKPDQFASDSCGDTAPAQEDAQDRLLTYFAEIREMKKVMRPKKLMLKTPRLLKSSSLIPLQRLPLGHQTAREPRAVDRTLEHGHIAFLEYRVHVGEGTNRQSAQSRAKKSQHFVPDANFDVQFLSDTHPREVALTLDRYSAAQNALVVRLSWVLFRPQYIN
jgi:hypothetical protein